MDIAIGSCLGIFGNLINNNSNYKEKSINPPSNYEQSYPINYLNNYESDIWNTRDKILYNTISDLYKKSEDDSKIVSNIWRIQNDSINQIKNKEINNLLNNDINMIKNIGSNNIETMKNINDINSDSDSIFSDNFSLPEYIPENKNLRKVNINDNISEYSDSMDSRPNINTRVLNTQDKFLEDIVSNLSGNSNGLSDSKSYASDNCTTFENQFKPLEFNHSGIPGTLPGTKQILNIFNDKLRFNPQSNFNPESDGRYGVTSDMTHDNMQPFFKSKTYGFNPEFDKEQTNYAVRKVELFTGSDQNPQFKHKTDVPYLFPPEIGKIESVTGVPNFSDFFESRVIPSDKRQGERPFQPVRVTPGLNLGYNEIANTGYQDLYRALPKNVDQLRTVDNPKVSYQPPVIVGQKGDRRGAIGDFIQKGPDRFYEQLPNSFLPQVGDFIAPAIYGKHLKTVTNRTLNPDNPHLNPVKSDVDFATPEYLWGQYRKTFKRTFDYDGPRNVQENTRGQIINQDTYVPTSTQRESMPELDLSNIKGNFISVPLNNYMNFVPETTLREIMLEDNGRKNLTNVSNSIKSYLFNAVNSVPDETLRSILTEKIILTNVKENSERGYLFNNNNAIQDPNMRNLSEDNLILGVLSNKEQGYLFNNINAIPDTNLRNLVNTMYERGGFGIQGNHQEQYMYNYNNATPQSNLRNLTEDQQNIVGTKGNHLENYIFNYANSISDPNLRNMVEDQKYIIGAKGNHQEQYAFNYENAIPNTNLRDLTADQKNIIGAKGNSIKQYNFNYENGIRNVSLRELTADQKNIIGTVGNKFEQYNFNYDNATPDATMRVFSGLQKNLIGSKGNGTGTVNFNYKNGTPDATMRVFSGPQKNIIGTQGDGTQSRSRLDADNAYLNVSKEIVAEGRDPVPVKENRGPTTQFTEYVFCDDSYYPKQIFSGVRPLTSVENELYTFSQE